MPKSTVSRHIAKLEDDLNIRLFDRMKDGFDLTPQGQRLYQRVSSSVHDLSIDAPQFGNIERHGRVSIHSPTVYGDGVLKPLIVEYLESRPDCSVDVVFADRFALPNLDEYDLGFFIGMSPGRDVDLWPVGFAEAKLYASPALLGDDDPPKTAADLKNWPLASSECEPGLTGRLALSSSKGESVLTGPVRLRSSNPLLLLEAALAGVAITRLPTFYAEDAVKMGCLIPILPNMSVDRHAVTIARSKRNKNPIATDFAEFAASALSAG